MDWFILILWVVMGVINFIYFNIDMKKNNNSELKYYFWQYLFIWIWLMGFLISKVIN